MVLVEVLLGLVVVVILILLVNNFMVIHKRSILVDFVKLASFVSTMGSLKSMAGMSMFGIRIMVAGMVAIMSTLAMSMGLMS